MVNAVKTPSSDCEVIVSNYTKWNSYDYDIE